MFLGPWDQGGPFDVSGISGVGRWLHRVWNVVTSSPPLADLPAAAETRELRRWTHKTLARVTTDHEGFRWNTMIAALMEYTNHLTRRRESSDELDEAAWQEAMASLTLMLAPLVPHIAEELWERLGKPYSVHTHAWPAADPALAADDEVEIAVLVNGKVRDRLLLPVDATEDAAREHALASASVQQHTAGKQIARVIYVPNRLLNIIVK
jgi:leucyl-tRNA synthetase